MVYTKYDIKGFCDLLCLWFSVLLVLMTFPMLFSRFMSLDDMQLDLGR